jgi:hypothetical protein
VLEWIAEATHMAQHEAVALRRELDRVTSRQGRCFPDDLKRRTAEWIAQQRAAGRTVAELASELGLAAGTALRWSSETRGRRALVPVEIVPDASAVRTVAVVSPSGFRLEGLSVAEAATLLRALG